MQVRKNEDGIFTTSVSIKGIKNSEPVRIVSFADVHLNYTNERDWDNDEIMYTVQCRRWNAGGASVKAVRRIMKYAKKFDRTVICGDVLDYMSYGAMELMEKYIWNEAPDVIAAIGGHDLTRQMQTGIQDKCTLGERQMTLQSFWKHDIYYFSETVKDSVMIIQLDNSCHRYWEHQIKQLENDILRARENNYVVLIFQHEPISTGKKEDEIVEAYIICDGANENFYDKAIGGSEADDESTNKVYKLITENADVVKGIFCGHLHSGYYTEVKASYIDAAGERADSYIPQYNMEGAVYDDYAGHVMEITIE